MIHTISFMKKYHNSTVTSWTSFESKTFLYWATFIYHNVHHYPIATLPEISEECFKTVYSLTVFQMTVTWRALYNKYLHPKAYQKKYLLWTQQFLKHYQTKSFLAHDLYSFPNTILKWVWYTVKFLVKLKVVSLLATFDWLILVTCHTYYWFKR